jgi:hypothetical protein
MMGGLHDVADLHRLTPSTNLSWTRGAFGRQVPLVACGVRVVFAM